MQQEETQQTRHVLSFLRAWMPFLIWGQQLTPHTIKADLMAGLTGAIVVLPQGVAYALIAGLPPEYGLYTAIITPVIAGLFGSSLHLISGPTAAISIVVLSVVSSVIPPDTHAFIPAVMTLTLLAGLIQLGLGLARMGTLVNFISHTVVIGFTAGAAILIATSQMKYILGIQIASGSSFVDTWHTLISQLNTTNLYSLGIALVTILTIQCVRMINPKIPAMLVGMAAGSFLCWLLQGDQHNVPLVGALPGTLPQFALPDLSIDTISALLPGAIAVAILGLVEAVSIARAIAIRSGQRIEGNQEFLGQGLSNIVGSFFSCYAGSGSFTRSGVNYDSGAQTPLAGISAAAILVLILLLLPDITAYLPMPAMAGAILLISWNLIDSHHIAQILKSNKQEAAILLITFLSTLFLELEFAIYLGVLVSLVLYLKRTSRPKLTEVAPLSFAYGTELRAIKRFKLASCPGIKILRIDGSIFFGAVDHIQRSIHQLPLTYPQSKQILIHCTGINFIDVSGAEMLLQESERLKKAGYQLNFCSLKNYVLDELKANGYLEKIGQDAFFPTVDIALETLVEQVELHTERCKECPKHVFIQCPRLIETKTL